MKFDCGLSVYEKQQWHDWFAWRPVRVEYGGCRWLETVERRGSRWLGSWLDWEYRAKNSGN